MRDHAVHAGNNLDLAILEMDEIVRHHQSVLAKMKNARKKIGYIDTATSRTIAAPVSRRAKAG
jgi:hypothetical protein